jgi:hypothetical protein
VLYLSKTPRQPIHRADPSRSPGLGNSSRDLALARPPGTSSGGPKWQRFAQVDAMRAWEAGARSDARQLDGLAMARCLMG